MRIIILLGMIFFWTTVAVGLAGIATSTTPRAGDEVMFMVAIFVGPMFGFVTGALLLWLIGSKPQPKRKRPTPRPRPIAESRPFRSRLANYTHQEEAEVMSPTEYRSKMPFWMAVDFFTRVPPKSAFAIRRILRRIRALASKAES